MMMMMMMMMTMMMRMMMMMNNNWLPMIFSLQRTVKVSLRVDPLFQKKKGSTKQRAKLAMRFLGF